MRLSNRMITAIKVAVFLAALVPFGRLVWLALLDPGALGPNPAEYIVRSTGEWCLRFVAATLAITPLRRWTGSAWVMRLRRMIGLYAFFYGAVHFASYISFDHVFDVGAIIKDIIKRPFITVGFAALLLMLPLAITSTNAMVRRLGGRRWLTLHRAVYAVGILGVVHYWMMVKRDITQPAIYALIVAVLLGARWVWSRRDRLRATARAAQAA